MSYTHTNASYDDEILLLARDPHLNREKGKTSRLVLIIKNFPLAERSVSRLCLLSLSILQTLEKCELTLRNWAFMSLDINLGNHFDTSNPDEIKAFNNNVSVRVVALCQELTVKLNKISADLDFITKALRSLSPLDFLSDSGTLLMSLTLRNIKLKDELRERVKIAYLKAKLITIGTHLESMFEGGGADQRATVASYQQFVVSLLRQLNTAVENQDTEDQNECLAVISDMEQMFEAYKLEWAREMAEAPSPSPMSSSDSPLDAPLFSDADDRSNADLDSTVDASMHSSYANPMVHSITKPVPSSSLQPALDHRHRRGSFSSVASTSILQKSTISEELPYLMSAFNLAKTLEEDVHHYKEEVDPEPREEELREKSFHAPRNHLPDSALYSDSKMLSAHSDGKMLSPSPGSYLFNNSLLSKLGIRPQVISAPKHLGDSFTPNTLQPGVKLTYGKNLSVKDDDKENSRVVTPLTQANLDSHNLLALTSADTKVDFSADYVE